jgi:hypothetical protein
MACAVLEPFRVADGIQKQAKTLGDLWLSLEQGDEAEQRVHSFRFVSVDASEDANFEGVTGVGTRKSETREVGAGGSLDWKIGEYPQIC